MMTSGALVGPDGGADGGVAGGEPFTGDGGVDELGDDGDSAGIEASSCWHVVQPCQRCRRLLQVFSNNG